MNIGNVICAVLGHTSSMKSLGDLIPPSWANEKEYKEWLESLDDVCDRCGKRPSELLNDK